MLRGNHPARVDDKGRLKIPTSFLAHIEATYGSEVFVTSVTGDNVRIYPMKVWANVEKNLDSMPDTHPAKVKYLSRVHYFGQALTLDRQGRLVIPSLIRESAQMKGDVSVLGKYHFLEVWNHEHIQEKLKQERLTDEDLRELSAYGI